MCDPVDCSLPGSSVYGILQARILEWVLYPPPGDIPNPGINLRSPTLQMDSLQSVPSGKPKNTEVSSLSLLQRIFLTHQSNQGLLHCRWILYQLSYQFSSVRWNLSETCYGQEALPMNLLEDEALLLKHQSTAITNVKSLLKRHKHLITMWWIKKLV